LLRNGKGLEIAKQIVLAKIKGQNELWKEYGLRWIDYPSYVEAVKNAEGQDLSRVRVRLASFEGKYGEQHFSVKYSRAIKL
jgi:CRISPR/Cas system-associated endonuclease Cas1